MPTTDADPATADWATIHRARAALADDLQSLDLDAWATPSLCTEWSEEDVVARFFATRDFAVASHTMAGDLALAATDGPFAVGDGPCVQGPTLALTMTMAGRDAWLDELSGPGVSVLRSRLDERRVT